MEIPPVARTAMCSKDLYHGSSTDASLLSISDSDSAEYDRSSCIVRRTEMSVSRICFDNGESRCARWLGSLRNLGAIICLFCMCIMGEGLM